MITKIEFSKNSLDPASYCFDLEAKKVTILKGKTITSKELCIPVENIEDLIKSYVTYWKKEYIDTTCIDGIDARLVITTDKETIEYKFIGSAPKGFGELAHRLESIAG